MNIDSYKKMYAILCAVASDAIDLLAKEGGRAQASLLLEKALLEAEEIYIGWDEITCPLDTYEESGGWYY